MEIEFETDNRFHVKSNKGDSSCKGAEVISQDSSSTTPSILKRVSPRHEES